MAESNNTDYYADREAVERKLAACALDPEIAQIHQQLAEEYARKIERAIRPKLRLMI